jgi:hypothetical protein
MPEQRSRKPSGLVSFTPGMHYVEIPQKCDFRVSNVFRGYRPPGRPICWEGAALFRFEAERIRELWVLGDLVGLDALLKSNS